METAEIFLEYCKYFLIAASCLAGISCLMLLIWVINERKKDKNG
jgi:hypothetical protein